MMAEIHTVNLDNLSSGIYLIELISEGARPILEKIIIQ